MTTNKYPKMLLNYDEVVAVELLYSKPYQRTMTNKETGEPFTICLWGVKNLVDNSQMVLQVNAKSRLVKKLLQYSEGDRLSILKRKAFLPKYRKVITDYDVNKIGENRQVKYKSDVYGKRPSVGGVFDVEDTEEW